MQILPSLAIGLTLLAAALPGSASAADDPVLKARELAQTLCVGCHGADGISPVDLYPNLKNQKATYLEKQLREFRDGKRTDPVMNGMAAPLDDGVIRRLAEHYARGAQP